MQHTTRILIGDDHELVRRGLRQMIERHPGWEVCAEATCSSEVLECAAMLRPNVVILDVSMPEVVDAPSLTRQLRQILPETEILIFTMHEDEEPMRAVIASGARGYVLKSDHTSAVIDAVEALSKHLPYFTAKLSMELRECFVKSLEGRFPSGGLTAREREIVQLVAEGHCNKQVATILDISVKTAETHRATIMHKLDLNSAAELTRYAVRNNLSNFGLRIRLVS